MELATIRRRIVVTGKAQGVFYRAWLVEEARALGVTGWVRNRADGSVEAVVQGLPEQVDAIVALAWEGSPASQVAGVAETDDARRRHWTISASGQPADALARLL